MLCVRWDNPLSARPMTLTQPSMNPELIVIEIRTDQMIDRLIVVVICSVQVTVVLEVLLVFKILEVVVVAVALVATRGKREEITEYFLEELQNISKLSLQCHCKML